MLEEALRWGVEIITLLFTEGAVLPENVGNTTRLVQVPESLLAYLSDTQSPQKLLFTCRIPRTDTLPVVYENI